MRRLAFLLQPYRSTLRTVLLSTLALFFISMGFGIIVLYDCAFVPDSATYGWLAVASLCLQVVLTVFYVDYTTDAQLRLLPLAQSTKFWLATLFIPAVYVTFTLLTPLAEGLWQLLFGVFGCDAVHIETGGYLQFMMQHWPLLAYSLFCCWTTQLVTSLLRVHAIALMLCLYFIVMQCIYVHDLGLGFEQQLQAASPAFGCGCLVASAAVLYGIYQVMRHWQIKNNGFWMI